MHSRKQEAVNALPAWRHAALAFSVGATLLATACGQGPPAILPGPAPVATPAGPQPIDLATALRLVDTSNPSIAVARTVVDEAVAREQLARAQLLPTLDAGPTYYRHDGETQNQSGNVFGVSRSNLFAGGVMAGRLHPGDAYFNILAARQLVGAATEGARSVSNDVQLDVALAYFDLQRGYAALAINADVTARAAEMLRRAEAAVKAGVSKTTADANRAATELEQRREERLVIETQIAEVSARLAQLLLLEPTVTLRPAEPVVPLQLLPAGATAEALVRLAVANRPEVAQAGLLAGAADVRVREAKVNPYIPRLETSYSSGTFGGGVNDNLHNFNARGDATVGLVWEFRNLGFGNAAEVNVRRAQALRAQLHVTEAQARVGAEVSASYKAVLARQEALGPAQAAVLQAEETWRKLETSAFGLGARLQQFDELEPLLAVQAIANARGRYLNQVVEYNRAQFRLYAALGKPPLSALAELTPRPVRVPITPQPYQPTRHTP